MLGVRGANCKGAENKRPHSRVRMLLSFQMLALPTCFPKLVDAPSNSQRTYQVIRVLAKKTTSSCQAAHWQKSYLGLPKAHNSSSPLSNRYLTCGLYGLQRDLDYVGFPPSQTVFIKVYYTLFHLLVDHAEKQPYEVHRSVSLLRALLLHLIHSKLCKIFPLDKN